MSYISQLVHLETGQSNESLLRISGDLAQRLKVDVIGIATRRADMRPFGEVYATGELLQTLQRENADLLQAAQKQFLHSLQGRGLALPTAMEKDQIHQLSAIALTHGADLIVAGAYGHQRLREWVFGGVTQELLAQPPCCLLLAH